MRVVDIFRPSRLTLSSTPLTALQGQLIPISGLVALIQLLEKHLRLSPLPTVNQQIERDEGEGDDVADNADYQVALAFLHFFALFHPIAASATSSY